MGYIVDIDNPNNIKATFLGGNSGGPVFSYDLTPLEESLLEDAVSLLNNVVNPNHRFMTFGFITDLHESYGNAPYGYNTVTGEPIIITSKHTLRLLGAIGESYGLDAVFFGGDYGIGESMSYSQYDGALEDLLQTVTANISVPHFATEGNHDRRKKVSISCRGNSAWRSFLDRFNTPGRAVFPSRNDATNGGFVANTYYVDFPKYKVRVVMRSQYETVEKRDIASDVGTGHFANNLEDCMTFDTPSEAQRWTVLCISHYAITDNSISNDGESCLKKYLNGELNDGYMGLGVVGEIYGHVHDASNAKNTMNGDGALLRLGQTNAFAIKKADDNSYANNDYRFSLYVVDTDNWMLHEIKVGFQYNRTDNSYYNRSTRIFSYPLRHNAIAQTEFKFLHISDPHTCTDSLTKCKELMDDDPDIQFTILTGDYAQNGESFGQDKFKQDMKDAMLRFRNHSFLLLGGNHEIYDVFGGHTFTKAAAKLTTDSIKTYISEPNVNWGDPEGKSSYYYVDYELDTGNKLRVISLDMYDISRVKTNGKIYDIVFSQDQIDWFILKISELYDDDYLLIGMHEPPVSGDYALSDYRNRNAFCSNGLKRGSFSANADLIPMIMNAYLHSLPINESVENENSASDIVSAVADFSNNSPCTFLGYLCGHIHGDFHYYHPGYSDQLIMCIDWANDTSNNRQYWSDIYKNATNNSLPHRPNGILINEVTIDFVNNKIRINRIGNGSGESIGGDQSNESWTSGNYGTAESMNGYPAHARTVIEFPFPDNQR